MHDKTYVADVNHALKEQAAERTVTERAVRRRRKRAAQRDARHTARMVLAALLREVRDSCDTRFGILNETECDAIDSLLDDEKE